MIWWWFKNEYKFQPQWGKKIQLTDGLCIKYSVGAIGAQLPEMKFETWIGENHYVITKRLSFGERKMLEEVGSAIKTYHVLKITRKGARITLEINGESRPYYLKTPPIWKMK